MQNGESLANEQWERVAWSYDNRFLLYHGDVRDQFHRPTDEL